ncbi:hypothetical protein [Exiguobacterium sp. USCH10]|uniref:hypothetical protein n=1 Tax=Exiguobacterium sp. USCH10 TaxID=3024839 RepID=UPI0030B3B652
MEKKYLLFAMLLIGFISLNHPLVYEATNDATCVECQEEPVPIEETEDPDPPPEEVIPPNPSESSPPSEEHPPPLDADVDEKEIQEPVEMIPIPDDSGATVPERNEEGDFPTTPPVTESREPNQDIPTEDMPAVDVPSTPPSSDEVTEEEAETAEEVSGIIGISLLDDLTLDGSYSDRVTLTATGSGVLNLNLLKNRYVIFKIPTRLIPYINQASLTGTYDVPSISVIGAEVGRKTGTFNALTVNPESGQVIVNVNDLLNVSLLTRSTYKFTLSFTLSSLPLGHPQQYTFFSQVTNEIVDIELLSDGSDSWTLTLEGPLFYLTVPSTIDFGIVPLHEARRTVNRQTMMTLIVSHERALGYPWRLLVNASPLQTSEGDVLENSVHFRTTDGQLLPLEQGPQLITSGVMETEPTTLSYPSDEGIVLDLQTQTPRAQQYYSTITWTLVNAP